MDTCSNQSFFVYFKDNMQALGLDVPTSLYGTQAKAAATIGTMLTAIKTLGKSATVGELVGATTGLEKILVVGAASASYYTGAAVGSFAVATGRYASCGTSIADVIFEIRKSGFSAPLPSWLSAHFMRHPEIFDTKRPGRTTYAFNARARRK